MPHLKKSRILTIATAGLFLCLSLAAGTWADEEESAEAKMARAITAAPARITDKATIMDVDGTVLRQGSNGWTCLPGISLMPGDKHPMCNDAVWMALLEAGAAGEPFSTDVIGVSYMLAGDAFVNNADPTATDPNDGGVWVEEGPHLMILMPLAAMVDLPRDPFAGGPYVMWDKTPLAHVMVPVAASVR